MRDVHDPIARLIREAGARPSVSSERTERVRDAVHASWKAGVAAEKWRRKRTFLGAAAAVLVSAGALAVVFATRPAPSGPAVFGRVEVMMGGVIVDGETPSAGAAVGADASVVTTLASRVSLRLASGASLRLDERTRVTLVAPDRLRLASGAVYVDSGVAGGRTIVETPLGEASDVGTQFEVRVDGELLLVRVRDGAVVVRGERERLDAEAGEEVEIARGGAVARRDVLPYAATWDWVSEVAPPFALRGAHLPDFLHWAATELGFDVRFDAEAVAQEAAAVRLDGDLDGLSPRQALDVVIPSTGLGYSIDDGVLHIYDPERGDRR